MQYIQVYTQYTCKLMCSVETLYSLFTQICIQYIHDTTSLLKLGHEWYQGPLKQYSLHEEALWVDSPRVHLIRVRRVSIYLQRFMFSLWRFHVFPATP